MRSASTSSSSFSAYLSASRSRTGTWRRPTSGWGAYAERLTADLQKDLVSRRALAGYYGAVPDSVERTNVLLADPQSNPQELVVSAFRASEVSHGPQTRATWDEIISTGASSLLPRAAVEIGIADYYAADTARLVLDTVGDTAYRHRVRTIIPLEVQKAQRADPVVQAELRYQYSDVFSSRANINGDAVCLELALAALRSTETPGASPSATASSAPESHVSGKSALLTRQPVQGQRKDRQRR